jgi:hypothetical protein
MIPGQCVLYPVPGALCPVAFLVSCVPYPWYSITCVLSLLRLLHPVPARLLCPVPVLCPLFIILCLLYPVPGSLSSILSSAPCLLCSAFCLVPSALSLMFFHLSCPQRPVSFVLSSILSQRTVSYVLPSILSPAPCLICPAFYPVLCALSSMFCLLPCPQRPVSYVLSSILSPAPCLLCSAFYPIPSPLSLIFYLLSCSQRPVSYVLPSILSPAPCLLCSAFYSVHSALSPMFCLISCPQRPVSYVLPSILSLAPCLLSAEKRFAQSPMTINNVFRRLPHKTLSLLYIPGVRKGEERRGGGGRDQLLYLGKICFINSTWAYYTHTHNCITHRVRKVGFLPYKHIQYNHSHKNTNAL